MIQFQNISLKNFLSYGNDTTTIDLSQPGTTLIVGEDLDNTSNGKGGNGTGKSSILNALVYALYDKPISDISKDNLINNINKKNMEVTLKFIGDDGAQYEIRRERGMKVGAAGNNVYLYINGEDKTPDSQAATNAKIEQIIGIPYELFVRIVVFSASHTPFLDIKTEQQKEIIEELFGLTTISLKAELLKLIIKETKVNIEFKKVRIDSLIGEHERHILQVDNAKKRVITWQEQHDTILEQIRIVIAASDVNENNDKVQVSHQMEIERIENELTLDTNDLRESIQQQADMLRNSTKQQNSELVEKNKRYSVVTTQRTNIESKLRDVKKQYTKIEADLTHLRDAKCPYCLQKYVNATLKITESETLLANLSATILTQEGELDDYSVEITELQPQIQTIQAHIKKEEVAFKETEIKVEKSIKKIQAEATEQINEKLMIIENYNRHKLEITRSIAKHDELINAINPHIDPLDELLAVKLDAIDYTEVNKLTKDLEHQDFLLKLLTKKDSFVRKALLNKNIPLLNTRLRYYLSQLGLPHKVEFTKEMTATISQFGRVLDFGNLSAGQRARVNFALSLAFRDVLQNLHPKMNICMLDEILDTALDSLGVQAAAKLIKQKARDENLSMYVISHRDEIDSVFNNKMTIQMSNGFSSIKTKYEDTIGIIE
jgi:DNA repair exonuclease SbcCD ATPase subunit